jgi:hypothetical protein
VFREVPKDGGMMNYPCGVVRLGFSAGTIWVFLLSLAAAQSINLKDIAAVCSGLQTASASGGSGKINSGGYEFNVTPDKTLRITQSSQLISKIDKFTYQDYAKCVSDLAVALTRPPPGKKVCRLPSNGVEIYQNEFNYTEESGWRGGGYNQQQWCEEVIAKLRGRHPAVGSTFTVVEKSENVESRCRPFNCPQYNYICTIHVKTDPLYNLRESPECP